MQRVKREKGEIGIALSDLWVGIAAEPKDDGTVDIGFACHDGTYNIEFAVHTLGGSNAKAQDGEKCPTTLPDDEAGRDAAIVKYLVCAVRDYQQRNSYKFLGAGLS